MAMIEIEIGMSRDEFRALVKADAAKAASHLDTEIQKFDAYLESHKSDSMGKYERWIVGAYIMYKLLQEDSNG